MVYIQFITIEEIYNDTTSNGVGYNNFYYTNTVTDIRNDSCLDEYELFQRLGGNTHGCVVGYAIHILNLEILDKPKHINDYWNYDDEGLPYRVNKLDEGISSVHEINFLEINNHLVLTVESESLCKILNKKQTMLVFKNINENIKVLEAKSNE